jgi:hypothetical protein
MQHRGVDVDAPVREVVLDGSPVGEDVHPRTSDGPVPLLLSGGGVVPVPDPSDGVVLTATWIIWAVRAGGAGQFPAALPRAGADRLNRFRIRSPIAF